MDIPFAPWPSLKTYAKLFPSKRFPGLFYYEYEQKESRTNQPVLILIHGLGDEADTWRHLIPLLGEAGYRVLAPDLPGFGRSLITRSSSLGRHRDAVLELAKAACENHEAGAVLIGSSMGAAVAEAAVLAGGQKSKDSINPDNQSGFIKALILLGGCFPVDSASSKLLIMALPFIGKKWYRSFRTNPEGAWQSLFSYYGDIHKLPEEDKEFLRNRVMERVQSIPQERGYFSSLRSMIFQSLRPSYFRSIGKWPGKIALIWGEDDHLVPHSQTNSFRKLRMNNITELTLINDAGHLPHQEKPVETAEAILAFLKTLSP
ncbi:MAG: alpha/beta hydrolase [Treponema sp.]|jgi:pimeloyl-ACP methyl ester carboxylesterase|nr:alpha/beta hydrolase [Treponema sp.]